MARIAPRGLALAALLLQVTLAGCFGDSAAEVAGPVEPGAAATIDPAASAAAPPVNATALEAELGALTATGNETKDDWFLLAGNGAPGGVQTGFQWRVPEGAVVPEYWDEGDPTYAPLATRDSTLVLELAPLVPEGGDWDGVVQYNLLAFAREGNAASLLSYTSRGQWHEEFTTVALKEQYDDTHARLQPFTWHVAWGEVADGDDVFFVLNADTTLAGEFGIAFRVLPEDPGCCTDPPPDFEAFRSNVATPSPVSLPRLGAGSGYAYPSYYAYGVYYGLSGEGWTKDVKVQRGLPSPVANAMDLTISYDFPVERGWGYGYAYASFAGTGTYSYEYSIHGKEASDANLMVAGCGPPLGTCFGAPASYEVAAEGEGGGAAQFRFTLVDVYPFAYAGFEHIDFATPLVDLIGVPQRDGGDSMAAANVLRERFGAVGPALERSEVVELLAQVAHEAG